MPPRPVFKSFCVSFSPKPKVVSRRSLEPRAFGQVVLEGGELLLLASCFELDAEILEQPAVSPFAKEHALDGDIARLGADALVFAALISACRRRISMSACSLAVPRTPPRSRAAPAAAMR